MKKTNTAIEVANYVIDYCGKHNCYISNLQLQSILYIIQRNALGRMFKPAFDSEIVAWSCGPIIPTVYHEYASYINSPIFNRPSKNGDIENVIMNNLIYNEVILKNMRKPTYELAIEMRNSYAWNYVWKMDKSNHGQITNDLILEDFIKNEMK